MNGTGDTSALDPLTGLAGRDRLLETAAGERNYALVVFDVAGLGQIKRVAGRDAGDAVLIEIAERAKGAGEHLGTVLGRWGGDRFAYVLPGVVNQTLDLVNQTLDFRSLYEAVWRRPDDLRYFGWNRVLTMVSEVVQHWAPYQIPGWVIKAATPGVSHIVRAGTSPEAAFEAAWAKHAAMRAKHGDRLAPLISSAPGGCPKCPHPKDDHDVVELSGGKMYAGCCHDGCDCSWRMGNQYVWAGWGHLVTEYPGRKGR